MNRFQLEKEFKEKFRNHFGYEWDPQRIDLIYHSEILAKEFSDYLPVWWNPDRFDWGYSDYLVRYCAKYFDLWWNANKFDWIYRDLLIQYCSDYFHLWWNPKKFYRDRQIKLLSKFCRQYKHIWYHSTVKLRRIGYREF